MRETRAPVSITISDFIVTSPASYEDDWPGLLADVADDIRSDLGSRLASLGTSCELGTVTVECDGTSSEKA